MYDITRAVRPPRSIFVDFPPGHTTGPPFDQSMQDAVVRAALRALSTVESSGSIVTLALQWPGGDGWKAAPLPQRLPRLAEPQYQCDADRALTKAHDDRCPACLVGLPPPGG